MKTNILTLVITLVVGIILAGGLLAPVLSDATESYYTKGSYSNIVNEDQISLKAIDADSSNTLNIDSTGITTTEGVIPYWTDTTYTNAVLITDTIMVTVTGTGAISTIQATGAVTTNNTSFTAVISAGSLTYSIDGGDAVSTTYTNGYVAAMEGDYVSTLPAETKYVDSDNFAQGRARQGVYYVIIDGVGYANGVQTTSNIAKTPIDGTDDQVFQLGEVKVGNWVLSTAAVVEKSANYRFTDEPGIVGLYGAILPIVIVTLVLCALGAVFYTRGD